MAAAQYREKRVVQMRTNSNKKIHKMKRDPYKVLLKMTGILAIVVVAGVGIMLLCDVFVRSDYQNKKMAVEKANIDAEQEFNAKMNALRSSNSKATVSSGGEVAQGDLPSWEKTVGDSLWRIEDEGYAGLENTSTVTLDRSTLLKGGLILVNAWHPLPPDFTDSELVGVGITSGYKIQVQNNTVQLFPAAYDALAALMEAATAEKLADIMIWEGYRTNDEQTKLFEDKKEALSKDYSGDILIEQTKKSINYPGTSEFQSGLSFRIGLYNKNDPAVRNQKFFETPQGKWILENAWRYGFVFRFPTVDFPTPEWEDKSYKTGVTVALNVFRYVGRAHAAAMQTMGYCLEEYVEFLIDHPHLCIYEDGQLKYEILRIKAEDAPSYDLPVPNPASDYQASVDNMGGVVMAYTYNQ